ncbi:MAG TPA: alpha/beta hydrolase, partial [Cyclobacteriaceae bacterium]
IIQAFIKENNIQSFSVLGYSMGGKFALATLEGFPTQVKEIFLLAPDGIKISPWYWLATYPSITRSLFKSMIMKPERYQFIANTAFKVGLIDKGILRFTETQMNTEEKRKQVYFSWIVFRHLKFSLQRIADLINSNNIQVTAVAGRHDKIMKPSHMKRLLNRLNTSSFEILEVGHNGLIRKWIETRKAST